MPDTIRSKQDFVTLLSDSAEAKSTNRQILRDLVVSALTLPNRVVQFLSDYLNNNARFNVKDYGAIGNGIANDTAAVLLAIAAIIAANGGILSFPQGSYLIDPFTLPDGCTLRGVGKSSVFGTPTTRLVTTATGADAAIVINNGSDISLENFYLQGRAAGSANEIDIINDNRRISVQNVVVNSSSTGACLGLATAGGSVIESHVKEFTGVGAGWSIKIGPSCTSVHFSSCYANVCTAGGYSISGTYLSFTACAADSNVGFGYDITDASAISFTGCGAELNTKGANRANNTSVGITWISCRGVSNNSSATTNLGSFLQIGPTGTSYQLTLIGCMDSSPNAATTESIRGESGQSLLTVIGYNSTSYPKGIGGDASWLANHVTYVGSDLGAFKGPVFVGGLQTDQQGNIIAGLDVRAGTYYQVTLNASRTFVAPVAGVAGQRLVITVIQDAIGGWVPTWDSVFIVSWVNTGNIANKRSTTEFYFDGTHWNQVGAQSSYA